MCLQIMIGEKEEIIKSTTDLAHLNKEKNETQPLIKRYSHINYKSTLFNNGSILILQPVYLLKMNRNQVYQRLLFLIALEVF